MEFQRLIYLDNYRGFNDSFLPLNKVNFLVGENSTGKSSIVHLINLFSSEDFWNSQNFCFGGTNMVFFDDIVSSNSKNKKYFTVGMAKCYHNNEESIHRVTLAVITFRNKNGKPDAQKFSYLTNKNGISFIYGNRRAKFKKINANSFFCEDYTNLNLKSIFNNFILSHKNSSSGYSNIKFDDPFLQSLKLTILPAVVLSKAEDRHILDSLVNPKLYFKLASFDPIRSKAKRTYDGSYENFSTTGEHTPYLIQKIKNSKKSKEFLSLLNIFGITSGLYESIEIDSFNNKAYSPFELKISFNNNKYRVNSVGYGVSQILPIVVEMITQNPPVSFVIQQPEIHLHPKAQAAFGELLFKVSSSEDKHFILETHSDYIIDRYRLSCHLNNIDHDSQVIFFKKTDGENTFNIIPIEQDGKFSPDQPPEFKEFFLEEEIKLLSI